MKENQPTDEFRMPIALSIPCTGNGVNTSQRLQPESRTFCAACRTSAGVVNSAIIPYGLEEPFIAIASVHAGTSPLRRRANETAETRRTQRKRYLSLLLK